MFVKQYWLSRSAFEFLKLDDIVKSEVLNKTYRAFLLRQYCLALKDSIAAEPEINPKRKYQDLCYFLQHKDLVGAFCDFQIRPIHEQIEIVKWVIGSLTRKHAPKEKTFLDIVALEEPRAIKVYLTPDIVMALTWGEFLEGLEHVIQNGDASLLSCLITETLIGKFAHAEETFLLASKHERLEMMSLVQSRNFILEETYVKAFLTACESGGVKTAHFITNYLPRYSMSSLSQRGLDLAIKNNQVEMAAYLLEKFKFSDETVSKALYHAVMSENKPIVSLLMKHFKGVNAKFSPQFFVKAARLNLTEVIIDAFEKKLLPLEACPNMLKIAVQLENITLVRFLITHKEACKISDKKMAFIFKNSLEGIRSKDYNFEIFRLFFENVTMNHALFLNLAKRIHVPSHMALLMTHPITASFSPDEWHDLFQYLTWNAQNDLIKAHCINSKLTPENIKSALYHACYRNNLELFQLMLDFAQTHFRDNFSEISIKALNHASDEEGHIALVEFALKCVSKIDDSSLTDIYGNISKDRKEIYILLRKQFGYPITSSMLPMAAKFGDAEAVEGILHKVSIDKNIFQAAIENTAFDLNIIQLLAAEFRKKFDKILSQDLWGELFVRAASVNAVAVVNFLLNEHIEMIPPKYVRAGLGLATLMGHVAITRHPKFGDPVSKEEMRQYLEIYCKMNFINAFNAIMAEYPDPDPDFMGNVLIAACDNDHDEIEIAKLILPYTYGDYWKIAYQESDGYKVGELLQEYARSHGIVLDPSDP